MFSKEKVSKKELSKKLSDRLIAVSLENLLKLIPRWQFNIYETDFFIKYWFENPNPKAYRLYLLLNEDKYEVTCYEAINRKHLEDNDILNFEALKIRSLIKKEVESTKWKLKCVNSR